jgi:hypothetical protein
MALPSPERLFSFSDSASAAAGDQSTAAAISCSGEIRSIE